MHALLEGTSQRPYSPPQGGRLSKGSPRAGSRLRPGSAIAGASAAAPAVGSQAAAWGGQAAAAAALQEVLHTMTARSIK